MKKRIVSLIALVSLLFSSSVFALEQEIMGTDGQLILSKEAAVATTVTIEEDGILQVDAVLKPEMRTITGIQLGLSYDTSVMDILDGGERATEPGVVRTTEYPNDVVTVNEDLLEGNWYTQTRYTIADSAEERSYFMFMYVGMDANTTLDVTEETPFCSLQFQLKDGVEPDIAALKEALTIESGIRAASKVVSFATSITPGSNAAYADLFTMTWVDQNGEEETVSAPLLPLVPLADEMILGYQKQVESYPYATADTAINCVLLDDGQVRSSSRLTTTIELVEPVEGVTLTQRGNGATIEIAPAAEGTYRVKVTVTQEGQEILSEETEDITIVKGY